jgi:hypothetical protein
MNYVSIRKARGIVTFLLLLFWYVFIPPSYSGTSAPSYVGAEACRECHPVEYESFITYAKKSKSFESIEKLRKGLTAEELERCYSCHTTGYGKPGGFISADATPWLKNAGCEVCHGPGSNHVISRSSADIKSVMTTEDCEGCHISERVKAFRYKPMIHGGAH